MIHHGRRRDYRNYRECTDHKPLRTPLSPPRAATLLGPLVLILALAAGCSGEVDQVEQAVDEGKTQAEQAVNDAANAAGETTSSVDNGSTQYAGVVRIVDGDTIEVNRKLPSGNSDVRFLAVDTPETTGGESQPLGEEAKNFTASQLESQDVNLEYDQDVVDPYDRTLAHVSVVNENRTIQEQLLEKGYAQTAWFPPNDLYKEELESIQQDARERGVGIWGLPLEQRCELTSRGNGIGEDSAECEG